MTAKPKVLLIGTGGTLSHVGRHPFDYFEYTENNRILEADEVVARFPELAAIADVVPLRFRALPSTAVSPADWLELNEVIHRAVRDDPEIDGIVVTHGTASLEETAYFLNLTLKIDCPVVMVGAQRPMGVMSTDADLNVINAVRVAGAPNARGLGVLVVLNEEIQAARDVAKTAVHRVQTFASGDLGLLGYADSDGRVVMYRSPIRKHAPDTPFDVRGLAELPRVDIAYSYAGADGTAIDAFVGQGARAIVNSAFPPGRATPAQERSYLEAQRQGVLIVQGSRARNGRVIPRRTLQAGGRIFADNLSPQKARVLVMVALTLTSDPTQIQGYFEEY
jgi:L-asparaginase